MKFVIRNAVSGLVIGEYEGNTEAEALEAMARDVGYPNYASIPPSAVQHDIVFVPIAGVTSEA